jgi:hypothetical protein
MSAEFVITSTMHADCIGCLDEFHEATVMARMTGSVGATCKTSMVDAEGQLSVLHSATAARARTEVTA